MVGMDAAPATDAPSAPASGPGNGTVLHAVKPGVERSACVCGWGALRGDFMHRPWCPHAPYVAGVNEVRGSDGS